MIPDDKHAAVARALQDSFGVPQFDDIQRIVKGLGTELVFRIVVRGSPYILRIMTRIDERMDPGRIFACMRAAAAAGLTPGVRYTNADDGISISDFVEAVPLRETQALTLLPDALRRLHALPRFPKTFNYVTAHNGFIWRFRKAHLLPDDEVENAFARYEQVCAAYPRLETDMVSCHMDPKPENLLFDGQRIWLVEWQTAFVNDRYFDLAVAANFLVSSDAEELTYLERYFGRPPDDYRRARFFLMRQVLHMFAATVFLLVGSAGTPIDVSGARPSFRDVHRQIWAGEIDLADNDARIRYGLVHWDEFMRNVQHPRFDEAVRIVSERHAGAEDAPRLLPIAP
jgi:hypothetical protein